MRYLLLAILMFMPLSADAVWFDSNWDYRVKIEINPNQVGTTSAVTNFPVFNDCGGFPANFWSVATTGDIRVVESDEVTETAFEIVSFSTTSKRCELHFKADSLSTTSSSTFYIYYGNPAATAYAVTDTFGRNNVWTEYLGVWHLQDTAVSASGNYDLTNNNVAYTDAFIARGGNWNSTTDNLTNSNTIFDFGRLDNFTVSAWTDSVATSANQFIVSNQQNSGDFVGWSLYHGSLGRVQFDMFQDLSPIVAYAVFTDNYQYDTNDRHIVFSKSTSADVSGARIYVDGVSRPLTTSFNNLTSSPSYTTDLQWGNRQNGFNLNADLDELRISTNELSAAWVRTEFNNQSSTSTFFYIGPEETEIGGTFPVVGDVLWFE